VTFTRKVTIYKLCLYRVFEDAEAGEELKESGRNYRNMLCSCHSDIAAGKNTRLGHGKNHTSGKP